jgi:hypothetical protein
MPADDLLRFIGGPLAFSYWWLVLGVLLLLTVTSWYAAIFVWTLPPSRLRRVPVIGAVHGWINRRRFVRVIQKIDAHYRDGGLTPAQASAGISRALRSFLYVATGIRAQYMHVEQLADGRLGAAAPVLNGLNDAQFNPEARTDVGALARSAEELISSWT